MKATTRTPASYLHYYGKLHGKTVTKFALSVELTQLQNAITTRVIRKTYPHVKLIANIQNQYIKLINSPNSSFKISIKDPTIYNVDGLGFAPVVAYVARKAGKAVAVYAAKKVAEKVKNKISGKSVSGTADEPIYTQFKDKGKLAIKHLLKTKQGQCTNALYRDDIGYIDIIWGENNPKTNIGFGLKHIVEKHGAEIKELGFNLEDFVPLIVQFGAFNKTKSVDGKQVFESKEFRFVVQTNYKGNKKQWLLSAFDLRIKLNKKTLGTIKTVHADYFTLGTLLQATNVKNIGINQTIDGINLTKKPLPSKTNKLNSKLQKNVLGATSNVKYDWRKTTGGYAVDKYEFGNWAFVMKFSTKKEALAYINSKTNQTQNNNTQTSLLGALGAKLLKSKFYAPYKTNAKGTLVSNLPLKASGEQSGVYQIKEVATGNIVYVGFSSNNLYRTILRHFQQWTDKSRAEKTRFTYAKTGYTVRVLLCNPERAAQLEKALIQKYNPRDNATKYNNYLTDKEETAAVALYQNTYTEADKEFLTETDTNDLFGVQAKKPTKALGGVMNATDMANFKYTKIGFDGEYKRIFGTPANNFDMCINGEPGAGKTVFLLKFANYMAERFGNVLYVTTEEYGSATLKDKTDRFNVKSPNLYFAKKADVNEIKKYPIVFLDSVNHSKLTIDEYKQLREENLAQIFVLVLQNTKKGTFKGDNDWPHEVEIVCNLYKDKETGERILNFSKDRYNDNRQITLK